MTAVAHTSPKAKPGARGFDLLMIVMAVGFAVAIAALAWPAFRAGPTTTPGMILLLTVAAVALIGLFAFGRVDAKRPAGDVAVEMLDAMAEPAALVWAGGQVLAYNGAWASHNGATVALPKGKSAQALYMAFAQARKGEQGRAIVRVGDGCPHRFFTNLCVDNGPAAGSRPVGSGRQPGVRVSQAHRRRHRPDARSVQRIRRTAARARP